MGTVLSFPPSRLPAPKHTSRVIEIFPCGDMGGSWAVYLVEGEADTFVSSHFAFAEAEAAAHNAAARYGAVPPRGGGFVA